MNSAVYERPTRLDRAIELLGTDGARALSGGTDLVVAMRHGKTTPRIVVDIKAIPELAPRIEVRDGYLEIAANTVMTDLERHPDVRDVYPGLVEAAEVVGSVQIRNRATLSGNLVNASPAADTPPVLIALGAEVHIAGPSGSRSMPVDQFLVDYRTTALDRAELISTVRLPRPEVASGSAFIKLGVRRAMEISIVCVAAALELDADGVIASAGVGLGSVAPTSIRSRSAEEVLVGKPATHELFAEAGAAARDDARPIDDIRASADYRRAMVPVLVGRALDRAFVRARERRAG